MADDFTFKSYVPNWKDAYGKAQDDALALTGDNIVLNAKKAAPVFLGFLRRSIARTKPHYAEGSNFTRQIEIGFAEGNADAFKYALSVERGRRAGRMPPVDALIRWVELTIRPGQRNLKSDLTLAGNRTGKAYRQIKRGRRKDADIRSIAFLIARAIGRRGTKAQPFLVPAFNEDVPKINQRFQNALEKHMSGSGIPPAR